MNQKNEVGKITEFSGSGKFKIILFVYEHSGLMSKK